MHVININHCTYNGLCSYIRAKVSKNFQVLLKDQLAVLSRSGLVVLQSSMQLHSTRGDGDVCADIAGNSGAVLLELPPGDVANRLDTPDISSAQYSVAINAAL